MKMRDTYLISYAHSVLFARSTVQICSGCSIGLLAPPLSRVLCSPVNGFVGDVDIVP